MTAMGLFDLLNHLLNFTAPALVVGVLMAFLAPFLAGKKASAGKKLAQTVMNSAVGVAVLLAGLVLFGHDGKMQSYGALVLAVASVQWWAVRR